MFCSCKKCQKIGIGMVLGRVKKKLLAQAIPDKIFGSKWSNLVKIGSQRKVWYLFLRVFNCYSGILSS